ncbi:hypothetical protein F5Y00DRAFT_248000 [Daldinia vernicosa]|uniref:uncharacterized protein n=1 Tax=Daldinia vernicosa TaxID=114800 RepID=UPI002007209A|nr:uncharacterized protein F5Y00DRAFT_248000 [Daldinia vernicosa]KAI0844719.1 hypothetical protein F5Y00DRAFT_248000 [Daldinia vernicosa]
MSQPQDKTVTDVEKAQSTSSDTASIFSTSSFGSAKALFKKHTSSKSSKPDGSNSGSSSSPTQADQDELLSPLALLYVVHLVRPFGTAGYRLFR